MSDVVAIALTRAERALVLRALRDLVRREGESQAAADLLWMLDRRALGVREIEGLRRQVRREVPAA